jgi:hypothetical protein
VNVTVGCADAPNTPYDFAQLSDAVFNLDPSSPNTITVEGDNRAARYCRPSDLPGTAPADVKVRRTSATQVSSASG